jgi:hypothetical protein
MISFATCVVPAKWGLLTSLSRVKSCRGRMARDERTTYGDLLTRIQVAQMPRLTHSSTSGFVLMLNRAAVSWKSKRQSVATVALSSAASDSEAEFLQHRL